MVTNLVTLTPQASVAEGIARLLKFNLTGAPVIDERCNYEGVFSETTCLNVLTPPESAAPVSAVPLARDIMKTRLVTLTADMDVFEAVGLLLDNRISGAPVLDENGRCMGVFSEKTSMAVLLDAAYDQLPTSRVGAYIDPDPDRAIPEDKDLLSISRMLLNTHYRRLEVVREGRLLGQISRRDVFRALYDWSAAAGNPEGEHRNEPLSRYMDRKAMTIAADIDLLGVAQIFRRTNFRRLPVLRRRELVGQISRRDLLETTHEMMAVSAEPEKSLLYLSSLVDRRDAPM